MSSFAFNSQPLFQVQVKKIPESTVVSDAETVMTELPHLTQQQLVCRWISTGKAYPKMELQWILVDQDNS